jgi:hypothetical protein
MRTIRTKVYQFGELSKAAQDQALCDWIEILMEGEFPEDSPYYPAVIEMERMGTPWFLGETLFHDYRQYLIEDIEANEYNFTKDGKYFNS